MLNKYSIYVIYIYTPSLIMAHIGLVPEKINGNPTRISWCINVDHRVSVFFHEDCHFGASPGFGQTHIT